MTYMKNYQFNAAAVHVINGRSSVIRRLVCDSCKKRRPQDQYSPLPGFQLSASQRPSNIQYPLALHPCCNSCRRANKVKNTDSPYVDASVVKFWMAKMPAVRAAAYDRSILCAIEADDVVALWAKQKGRCALTDMQLSCSRKGYGIRDVEMPSIDRIDSSGNYTLDNIQIVSAAVNVMKQALPQDLFIALCDRVARVARAKLAKASREKQYEDLTEALCVDVAEEGGRAA